MEDRPQVARLSDGRQSGRSLLGVVIVAVVAVAIVGVGLLGERPEAPPAPEPRPAVTSAARTPAAVAVVPSATAAASEPPAADRFEALRAGYSVEYPANPSRRPTVYDDGALVVYGFSAPGAFGVRATIAVSVGSPAQGASLLAVGETTRIYADTLDGLTERYVDATGTSRYSLSELLVDGHPGRVLRPDADDWMTAAVGLIVAGDRAFVAIASGFEELEPFASDAAGSPNEVGLRQFLAGMTFGPGLFVERTLGFQVPMLVDERPFAVAVGLRPDLAGIVVFGDGEPLGDETWSHSIAVSVGTESRPALTRGLPSALPHPATRRIWAPTLPALVQAYRRLVDLGDALPPVSIELAGEPAVRIIRADGLAATVLAVHRGRVYIISTTGRDRVERAPHFEEFLATFAFLE